MKTQAIIPVDRGSLVGIIFFILGLGTLLPWNFFMTAITYFQHRLNTTEWINGTAVPHKEYHFSNWLTLLSQLPLLLFTLLNSFLYQRISEKMRIAGSLVFILLLFMLNATLVRVPMDNERFFSVTMATIWFINCGTDPESAALGYFITPCGGTVVTLISYLILPHLPFARYYFNKGKGITMENGTQPHHEETTLLKHSNLNGYSKYSSSNSIGPADHFSPSTTDSERQALLPRGQVDMEQQVPAKKSSVIHVFKKIWVMAFCITFVFIVTLSVFPAVTVDVKSKFSGRWELYFIPVCCFLNFNIMDWLSRTVTSVVQWPSKDSVLFPILVVARLIFIPLFMLCNVQYRSYLPVVFTHDAAFAVIMTLFSFTSGYFVCLTMSYAPL
ncbi:hypothetical protein JZ751_006977 [Albula glossodonta]|uniref:Solute carrier family 29 member 2 n=1 Tax=Albula glossodonta TaxID=121402 RepID=A0A8T2P269_9TELE|nr:hypothetical protein JZ751_006977 [Albula glossodonta]